MLLPFTKAHGTGNSFIIIYLPDCPQLKINPDLIQSLCNFNIGIGADGVLVLDNDDTYDFKMDYYNNDGSWETMCANGALCIIKLLLEIGFKNTANIYSTSDSAKFGGILSKNKPLPVILIFEKGNATQKRKIGEIYLDRIIDPKKVPEIKDLCIELDTINDSIIMAEKYKEKTDLKLDELGFSDSSKNEIYENLSYL